MSAVSPALAVPGNWDHETNIKEAAARLAKLHGRQGSAGVLKFLDACYRTHRIAEDYTQGLEACMAQDYMHTKILASVYSKLPDAELARRGAPTSAFIVSSMNARFVDIFEQYKVTIADAEDFKQIVEKVGVPIFVKGIFPRRGSRTSSKPPSKLPAGPK